MTVFLCGKTLLFASLSCDLCELSTRSIAWFKKVPLAPPDPILGLNEAFRAEKNPKKINLGVGAYRDDDGKPWVLPCVREAETRVIAKQLNKEYSTILGIPEFYNKAIELALGKDSYVMKEKINCTAQAIGGTGALRIGTNFLAKFFEGSRCIYVPDLTWANHIPVCEHAGLKVKRYRYYDPKTVGLDFSGMKDDICKIQKNSIILLHASAHNPTGIDPTKEQWQELSKLIKDKQIYPFFDLAYQGFATGDLNRDAQAVRIFSEDCHRFVIAQSFSKNMGLYGERAGAFSVICHDKEEAERVTSQVKIMIRALYSIPPLHPARIASEILNNEDLYCKWITDVKLMADRIIAMRKNLHDKLVELGSKRNWDHIQQQIGMFCFTGLNTEQVNRLIKQHAIFMTQNGRISMAGVTTKNIPYIAECIHAVTSEATKSGGKDNAKKGHKCMDAKDKGDKKKAESKSSNKKNKKKGKSADFCKSVMGNKKRKRGKKGKRNRKCKTTKGSKKNKKGKDGKKGRKC